MVTARQNLLIRAQLAIVAKVGPWDRGVEGDGAGYVGPTDNGGFERGFACGNCMFWKPEGRCAIVKGRVDEAGLCRFHVIQDDRLTLTEKSVGRILGELE